MKNHQKRAFTLIEMLVVIVIIGIILAIVISSATNLLNNRSKKAYNIHLDLVESATKTYIDQYKGQLTNDDKQCFNIDYNTLLVDGLLKEGDIKCDGNIIITKGTNNNFKSDFYFTCVDNNNEKVNTSDKVPSGCKGFNGKFKMEYSIYEDTSKQKVYDGSNYIKNAYVYFTSTSPYRADIDHYEYTTSLDGNWTKIDASANLGTIGDLKNFAGTLYVRSVDTDQNVSSNVEIPVKMDNAGPTFTTSVPGGYALTKTLSISGVTDSGVKTLADKAYSFDGGATWESNMQASFEENKTVNVCARDVLGNKTCKDVKIEGIDRVIPNTPVITASDNKTSGNWHNSNFNLTLSGANNQSGNTYYYGETEEQVINKNNPGNKITVSDDTTSKKYYYNVCSGTGLCSGVGIYDAKLDTATPSIKSVSGASTSWSGSNRTFTLTNNNTISGTTSAYYYASNSTTAPSASTTGTKCTSATSCSVGTGKYVYFRIVNGAGTSSAWSSYYNNYVDTAAPSAPTLTGGSSSWSSSAKTISVSKASTATSGIKYYQYYISTSSTSQTGGSWTNLASGTTSVSISTNGTRYIFFRAVSNTEKTGAVSAAQTTKIDTVRPPTPSLAISDGITSNNWHKANFTVTSSGGNNVSGNTYHYGTTVSASSSGSSTTFSTNTTAVTYYYKICSGAGLCSTTPASYIVKLDKTAPSIKANNANSYIASGASAATTGYFTISYSISSGSTTCTVANINQLSLGANAVTCTARGGSGLSASASTTFRHQYTATASCPSGYNMSSNKCTRTVFSHYSCPNGGTLSGSTCNTTSSYGATCSNYTCTLYKSCTTYKVQTCSGTISTSGVCVGGSWTTGSNRTSSCVSSSTSRCVEPQTGRQSACGGTESVSGSECNNANSKQCSSYSCPNGGSLSGSTCNVSGSYGAQSNNKTEETAIVYTCPSGGTVSGTTCSF